MSQPHHCDRTPCYGTSGGQIGDVGFIENADENIDVVATDKEAIQMCIRTCNGIDPAQARVVRISNSLHIGHIMLSEAYYQDVLAGKWPGLIARSAPEELSFDPSGALTTPIEA